MCKIREEQLEGCEEDLTNAVKKAYEMRDAILAQDPSFDNERFKKWQRALKSEGRKVAVTLRLQTSFVHL